MSWQYRRTRSEVAADLRPARGTAAAQIAVLERDSAVIKLYDAETLALTDCLVGHRGPVRRCLLLDETDYIVSAGADGCLIFWGAHTSNLRQVLPCDAVCCALAWDAPHRTLYAGTEDGTVLIFRVPEVPSSDVDVRIREEERFSAHADGVAPRPSAPSPLQARARH